MTHLCLWPSVRAHCTLSAFLYVIPALFLLSVSPCFHCAFHHNPRDKLLRCAHDFVRAHRQVPCCPRRSLRIVPISRTRHSSSALCGSIKQIMQFITCRSHHTRSVHGSAFHDVMRGARRAALGSLAHAPCQRAFMNCSAQPVRRHVRCMLSRSRSYPGSARAFFQCGGASTVD